MCSNAKYAARRYGEEKGSERRDLSHPAKSLIRHHGVLYGFATRGTCLCFKFVGFDIGRVCEGPLTGHVACGQIHGGGAGTNGAQS